jgi:dTDP-4-dehydrorhamnose reductase
LIVKKTSTEHTMHPTTPVLIYGKNGQVARALAQLLDDKAVTVGRDEADFTQPDTLRAAFDRVNPSVVINAVAYTQVDTAESDEVTAHTVNAEAPTMLAHLCAARGIPFVHYSTDYVFAGQGDAPFNEDAPTAPLNAYGRTKLAGEKAVMAAGGNYLIFRTSWVYDAVGKNFLTTMLRLGAEREALNIVADQIGAPSYAPHIAQATMQALQAAQRMQPFPSGIYHLCNEGETSWHGFAEEIFKQASARAIPLRVKCCNPIPASDYPTPAIRPHNSRLSCAKLHATFGVTLPPWQEGVDAALACIS